MAGEQLLEIIDSFRYLDDAVCAGGGCEAAIITRVTAAKNLIKITTFLITDMFRQCYCHRQCN